MNSAIRPALQHVLACACAVAACSAAAELATAAPQVASLSSEQLRAAYLECDRLSARTVLPPEVMRSCVVVADVLLHRDFGGDLESQLRWWRGARAASGETVAAEEPAGAGAQPAAAIVDP